MTDLAKGKEVSMIPKCIIQVKFLLRSCMLTLNKQTNNTHQQTKHTNKKKTTPKYKKTHQPTPPQCKWRRALLCSVKKLRPETCRTDLKSSHLPFQFLEILELFKSLVYTHFTALVIPVHRKNDLKITCPWNLWLFSQAMHNITCDISRCLKTVP